MTTSAPRAYPTFWHELADFGRFLRHPTLRRLPGRNAASSLASDWWPGLRVSRLLAWAVSLWVINLIAFGPLAVAVAELLGAEHRINPHHLPVLIAVFWAPLVEEMLFRYGLRRPRQALWIVPVMVVLVIWPVRGWSIAVLVCALIAASLPLRRGRIAHARWVGSWRREYIRHYGWVYHLTSLVFAAVHLHNFTFDKTTFWLLPFLVLPQWATGLVLGWMRTRRGIGASIALHSLFNGGPVLVILLILRFFPGADL
jgi:membrane protease YdiL (CAAX protease family)